MDLRAKKMVWQQAQEVETAISRLNKRFKINAVKVKDFGI